MKFSVPLKENHKALWNWLAKNPEKQKNDWPGWAILEKIYNPMSNLMWMHCFACEACKMNCFKCPCGWGRTGLYPCENNLSSIYRRWNKSTKPATRTRLALKIADAWR